MKKLTTTSRLSSKRLLVPDAVSIPAKDEVLIWQSCEILLISGYTPDTIVHHGVLEKGMQFIGKPFSRDELGHKVKAVLDK